jgi:hypothetical protein
MGRRVLNPVVGGGEGNDGFFCDTASHLSAGRPESHFDVMKALGTIQVTQARKDQVSIFKRLAGVRFAILTF